VIRQFRLFHSDSVEILPEHVISSGAPSAGLSRLAERMADSYGDGGLVLQHAAAARAGDGGPVKPMLIFRSTVQCPAAPPATMHDGWHAEDIHILCRTLPGDRLFPPEATHRLMLRKLLASP